LKGRTIVSVVRTGSRPKQRKVGIAALLLALACAAGLRPLTDEDTIAGVRALDTSYRVKDLVRVVAPAGRHYVLPVGEYRPRNADASGVLYEAPTGVMEIAGFSKHPVPGGVYVANAPGRPYESPSLWIEQRRGRIKMLPLPVAALSRYGDVLVFAVDGEERSR
jgi:hypothetical protein